MCGRGAGRREVDTGYADFLYMLIFMELMLCYPCHLPYESSMTSLAKATTSQTAWLITAFICQDKVIFYFLILRKVLGLRTFLYGLDFEGSKASQDGLLRLWLLPPQPLSPQYRDQNLRYSSLDIFSLPPSFAMPFSR